MHLNFSTEDLRPLVEAIVRQSLAEFAAVSPSQQRLAYTEPEAAELLGLHAWQLRDLRLSGGITYSRIVRRQVRYSVVDLLEYLAVNRRRGTRHGEIAISEER